MANLKETAQWEEGIYQWETTDPVLGGENGIDNKPTRQLANRTAWLKQELEAAQQSQRSRLITAGAGLIGGGNLSADRSIALATPSTLSGSTANWAGNDTVGHTHELAQATATLAGVVKLINHLNSTATDAALSAAMGKALNDAIAQLNTLLTGYTANSFCPSGMIMTFAADYAPAGWLKANGAAVSRTVYANLFAAIGTRYGAGDGHSTFNLPDLRGEFPRFWDDGRGVDAGRGLGTWQNDAIRNIAGNAATYTQDDIQPNGVLGISNKATRGIVWENNWKNYGIQAQLDFDASRVVPTANENRPRNIALLACIKI
jgi:hypothetical protein|nr:MAG TPA: tail collar fiber protein [Caudoviricetes sp.]